MAKTREIRLDYILKSMSVHGAPVDHPYLDKVRQEREEERKPYKIGLPNQEPKVDKGYRKILLVGFNGDLMNVLERAYKGSKVKKLEFVLTNSTSEAIDKLREEKFDYVFTAGLRADPDESKGIPQTKLRGGLVEKYVVPAVQINGYDISFVASQKGAITFVYDGAVDENRAKLMSAVPARSPMRLESELRECEECHKSTFEASRAARYEFIQALRKEKQDKRHITKTKEFRINNLLERLKRRFAFV